MVNGPTEAPRIPTGAQAIAQIKAALGTMVASERRVAEVVLNNPKDVIHSTASAIGERAGTSATTVIRFARSAGFSGYQELAIALAISEADLDDSVPELKSSDTPAETLHTVIELASRAIAGTASVLDAEQFAEAVRALAGARHVLCIGATLTASVAQDLAYRLNHLGISADAPTDHQIQRIRSGNLAPEDVCITFLHGGAYPHVVEVAEDAKATGATTIAITSFARTPITDVSDLALVVGARSATTGVDAWASRLEFLAVVDALVIAVANTDPGRYRDALGRISDLIERDQI